LISGAHISGANNDEYCSIYGTQGQIRLPDPYGSDPLRIYLKQPYHELASEQWHSISLEPVSVYQRAIDEYARAVQSGSCTPIDANAARQVLSVVLGIYRSAVEKRSIPMM
jgi:predicted dehydrogenase